METGVVSASFASDDDPDCLSPRLRTNPRLYQHRAGARTNARGSPACLLARKWRTHGKNLCAKYSTDRPEILHGLNFHIKSGECVGVVGRTGSGKSSLTLALLRCITTEGTVMFDDVPTSKINLDALRTNITIIPRVPELLSDTLRWNLVPFWGNTTILLSRMLCGLRGCSLSRARTAK